MSAVVNRRTSIHIGLLIAVLYCSPPIAGASEWQVPFGGNAYCTSSAHTSGRLNAAGLNWQDPADVWSVYIHVNRPARLQLSLDAVADRSAQLQISCPGTAVTCSIDAATAGPHPIGQIDATGPGYLRLDFRGISKTGNTFGTLKNLIITSAVPELTVSFVRSNQDNMFYWGRRGPSVHLTWAVPRDVNVEYAFTELLVPEGEDQIGSYFMANGFGEGYFGMQVNSQSERRILFSVWSPWSTDNPDEIPEDHRVLTVARGAGVHIGEFGNEGSGGQSYLVHPWKAGVTCRFLTRVQPADDNSTVYTSWFSDSTAGEWRLIASFRRPKTQTSLKSFHSFLENFTPATGHLSRRVHYSNIHVRDTSGKWHACTSARFSTDATGSQQHRLDFSGGADADHFFLQNCGFFNDPVKPGTRFQLSPATALSSPPQLPEQPR